MINDGIPKDKLFERTNYFERYTGVKRNPDYRNLLFYGAIDRAENYDSIIWFIHNEMDELAQDGYELTIVGENAIKSHKTCVQPLITLTGFVDSVDPYFEKALCLVFPLLLEA